MPSGTTRKTSAEASRVKINEAGANLFADLGIHNAAEKNTKIQLAVAIHELMAKLGLNQAEAAKRMRCTQPDVSQLTNYKLAVFSVERLIDFLLALNNDVEITIRPKGKRTRKPARTTVRIADVA